MYNYLSANLAKYEVNKTQVKVFFKTEYSTQTIK